MPEWIAAVLDVASWPARWFAAALEVRLTGWEYLALVVFIFVVEAGIVANFWNRLWWLLGMKARAVGRWSSRTGNLESMRLAEKNTARIQSICEWIRRLMMPRPSPRESILSGGEVPGLLVARGARVAQFMTRNLIDLFASVVSLLMKCALFIFSRWGTAALLLGVATVYPSAIPNAVGAAVSNLDGLDWNHQLITNLIAITGVVVAVGAVLVKGLLSDKITARRHVQEGRSKAALESLVPLADLLGWLSYYGSQELELVSMRLGWQMYIAEKWINEEVSERDTGLFDEHHLRCGVDCTDGLGKGRKPTRPEFPEKVAEVMEKIDLACEKSNPFHLWRREIARLSSNHEWSFLHGFVSDKSLVDLVKRDLRFLEKDRFEKVRIAWQHDRPPGGVDEERSFQLERLASDYREFMWDTLEKLRVYKELSAYSWRINRPRAGGLAKVTK